MHHLIADDKALILTLQVVKRWNVDKMILEFPNKQWKRQALYYDRYDRLTAFDPGQPG